jgi:hypothetical protein
MAGAAAAVGTLLAAGVDPVRRDARGRVAYMLAKDRPTRDAFRRAMASLPTQFDWAAAQVPGPLTGDDEAARRDKARAARARKRRAARERGGAAAAAAGSGSDSDADEPAAAAATAPVLAGPAAEAAARAALREQLAKAAERRLATPTALAKPTVNVVAGAGPCAWCGQALPSAPFSRLQFLYCSTRCVREHRAKLEEKQS